MATGLLDGKTKGHCFVRVQAGASNVDETLRKAEFADGKRYTIAGGTWRATSASGR